MEVRQDRAYHKSYQKQIILRSFLPKPHPTLPEIHEGQKVQKGRDPFR